MRTVYLNGNYVPENEAQVSVFDRGFLMADGVYEVTSVLDGKLIDFAGHAKRLERSLNELDMQKPDDFDNLLEVHRELVKRNEPKTNPALPIALLPRKASKSSLSQTSAGRGATSRPCNCFTRLWPKWPRRPLARMTHGWLRTAW